MSEQHVEMNTGLNGPTASTKRKKGELAKSTVDGSVTTWTVSNGESVTYDVATFPPAVQMAEAVVGARTDVRLSFLKMDDPAKIAEAIRKRVAQMQAGELSTGTRSRTPKEPDELTQAVANVRSKSTQWVDDKFYPAYFADSARSGCETRTANGKVRIYHKKEALARLRRDPSISAEIQKIVKARGGKADPAQKLDLASIAVE
jgi:hypothetical protein